MLYTSSARKIKSSLSLLLLPLFLLLAACSAHDPHLGLEYSDDDDTNAVVEPEVRQEIQEYDQQLALELQALEKQGGWTSIDGRQVSEADDGGLGSTGEEGIAEKQHAVYDFPVTYNHQVAFYIDLFQKGQRKYMVEWLGRSSRYLPMIQQELKEAGLPQDLAYLAMIESGFKPTAYSSSHAAGIWQFMKPTAHRFGLRVDSWIDERRHAEKSTTAAVEYLRILHDEFDSWYLAVAAYNAGEGNIRKAIKQYGTEDFWKLASHSSLKLETKRYVPKLIAAIIIAKDPEKYGFGDVVYEQPTPVERIKVPPRTHLAAVALTSDSDPEILRKLNIELRLNQTPPDDPAYELRIPAGTKEMVMANLKRMQRMEDTTFESHSVKSGESLTTICRIHGISITDLLKANNLRSSKLRAGQHLRIPREQVRYVLMGADGKPERSLSLAITQENRPLVAHKVRPGETISSIAKANKVSVQDIIRWNNLKNVRSIRVGNTLMLNAEVTTPTLVAVRRKTAVGQELKARTAAPARTTGIQTITARAVKTPVNPTAPAPKIAASTAKAEAVLVRADLKKTSVRQTVRRIDSKRSSSNIIYYMVRNGDSISTIARKFDVSPKDIRNWNGLKSNLIHTGTHLIIKKA